MSNKNIYGLIYIYIYIYTQLFDLSTMLYQACKIIYKETKQQC